MGFDALPQEVIHTIISSQSPKFSDLRNYSLVCRRMWEAATTVMYAHIDLTIDDKGDHDKFAKSKTQKRQTSILQSIASNPSLGLKVRTFKNYHTRPTMRFHTKTPDATQTAGQEILRRVAQNMTSLTKGSFTDPLATHALACLSSYPKLVEFSLRLPLEIHGWQIARRPLRKLNLEIYATASRRAQSWNMLNFVLKIVKRSFPELESLDVSFLDDNRQDVPSLGSEIERMKSQRPDLAHPLAANFPHLKHLGFRFVDMAICQDESFDASLLDFVKLHEESLESISFPIPCESMSRKTVEYIIKVCASVQHLRCLDLTEIYGFDNQDSTTLQPITQLTTALASPAYEIERFSLGSVLLPFSPTLGALFSQWKSLTFLRLGDWDNNIHDWPYGTDGRPQFDTYGPEILKFIQALPPSIQAVYLEINGNGISCDEDADFNPLCDFSTFGCPLFKTLRRLHTCDIHAWISNVDGGLGQIPEKAVFYRRLHSRSAPSDSKKKEIWTSRMDCAYQMDYEHVIVKDCEEVEGAYEGDDAEEIWLDGYEFEPVQKATGRGHGPDYPDYSWPQWKNKVNGYPMFRKDL